MSWTVDVDVIDDAVARAVQRAMGSIDLRVAPGSTEPVQPGAMPFRRGRNEPEGDDTIDLTAPEYEWWAGTSIDPFARPAATPVAEPEPAPEPAPEPKPNPRAEPRGEVTPDDPYVVLRVAPSADWDTIVAAYRKLARWYHPDGLVDPSPDERAACDDMIRRLNAAYAELRVRRGR